MLYKLKCQTFYLPMKRLILNTKRKSSAIIIGLLLLANVVAFGLASHYLRNPSTNTAVQAPQEQVIETGWQVLGWGYSLLEFISIAPQS